MIEHFYQDIEGWFDFEDVYREAVQRCPDGGRMVEVGVYYGKSLAFLAVEVYQSRKNIMIYGVDPFNWPNGVYSQVSDMILDHQFSHFVHPIRAMSVQGAKRFDDASLDFVFIDAAHDYANVTHDVRAWWPKVKPGGVLAGHDWCEEFPGVGKAVTEQLQSEGIRLIPPKAWWVEKRVSS